MKLGILGGGQLARMLALAGLPLGIRCKFLDPAADAVAGHCGELLVGPYDDPALLAQLADGVDAVTFEFENVPAAATQWLEQHLRVAPTPRALAVGQDRLAEKTLFAELGFGVPKFAPADSLDELRAAVATVGLPCIVKTRRLGYDGKGQHRLREGADQAAIDAAFTELHRPGHGGLIVEGFVPFDRELSVIAVRSRSGEVAIYPLVENVHEGGILRRSRAPAPDVPAAVREAAEQFVTRLLTHLDYVGVLAVELFLAGDRLLANEMAPRVHNSGHWTIEGSVCSQFENHVRAVLGLPLGSTAMAGDGFATMLNVIGTMPARTAMLEVTGAHLHDYGKKPRAGRKLGHVTVVERARETADAVASRAAGLLRETAKPGS